MRAAFLVFVLLLALPPQARAQTSRADSAAIRETALDYIEGWYDGDAKRMERALHPDLAKRIVTTDTNGVSRFGHQSAMTLVQGTASRASRPTPPDKRQKDVTILDVYRGAAVVKIVATEWVDYLQVAKFNGRWRIVNVLWELKPPSP
jgi:hypothetical protein